MIPYGYKEDAVMPSSTISIRIPDEIRTGLDALATATGRSRNHRITEAISAYVHSQEWQIAEIHAGLAELDAGHAIPLER